MVAFLMKSIFSDNLVHGAPEKSAEGADFMIRWVDGENESQK